MTREKKLDVLRFIGLSLIILAHVNPPESILDLVSCNVPLMLFVSGIIYADKNVKMSWDFIWHRTKRLVVPVYLFLIVYFAIALSLQHILNFDLGIRAEHIIGSFLLMDGIGFVWIIRVFLLVALITPWLIWINNKIRSDYAFVGLLLCMMCLQELIIKSSISKSILCNEFILYGWGYSILFLLGMRLKKCDKIIQLGYFGIFTVLFMGYNLLIINDLQIGGGDFCLNIKEYKWPPQFYYIAYGAMACILFYWLINRMPILEKGKILLFIGQNTIWIYLYHIPILQITGKLNLNWSIRFCIVYMCAICFVWIQLKVVNYLESYSNISNLQYLKG